ncbi:hypothetical protein HYU92_00050 [Candidatus Curtissbacteria bacterium]|nr:hypothetical protein [Candidatus Curtissbacteria bacterium]
MDDSGSGGDITDEVAGIAADVAKGLGGGFKKIGKTAVSQITGAKNQPLQTSQTPKSSGPPAQKKDFSLLSEIKKAGQTVGAQITGAAPPSPIDLGKMQKKDQEFSQQEIEAVRAKVRQIYQEYAARKAQERKQAEMVEQKEQEQKGREIEQIKRVKEPISPQIAKTRAEIKNYGAE